MRMESIRNSSIVSVLVDSSPGINIINQYATGIRLNNNQSQLASNIECEFNVPYLNIYIDAFRKNLQFFSDYVEHKLAYQMIQNPEQNLGQIQIY